MSKWGRCRAHPVGDKARHKEWQRSKFCELCEQKISGTATGHNGAPHKINFKNRIHFGFDHIRRDIEVVITGLTRNFVVILELSASHPLIYKGFPQFKYNLIR